LIIYSTCDSLKDLEGIYSLQKNNLPGRLTADEIRDQGFVTVDHSLDLLEKLNIIEKHVIAREDDNVIGYVLAMTQQSRFDVHVLIPMFEQFEFVLFKGKLLSLYNYIIVGQVCIDKLYRGLGIFDHCYETYKKCYGEKYDFAITEIASHNLRSRHAHKRIGFEEVHTYTGPDNVEWVIVIWDWMGGNK
jgi:hypothetical protein